jgi:hypothetical protein
MLRYPDNRGKFKGTAQWDVSAGNGRPDNPVANRESKEDKASRGATAPRDVFRVTTTEDPALLQAQAEAEAIAKHQKDSPSGSSDTCGVISGSPKISELALGNASSSESIPGAPSVFQEGPGPASSTAMKTSASSTPTADSLLAGG